MGWLSSALERSRTSDSTANSGLSQAEPHSMTFQLPFKIRGLAVLSRGVGKRERVVRASLPCRRRWSVAWPPGALARVAR